MENNIENKEEIINEIYNKWCQLRKQTNDSNRYYGCGDSIEINSGCIGLSFGRCRPDCVTLRFSPNEPVDYMEFFVEDENEEFSDFEFPEFHFTLLDKDDIEYAYEEYIKQWLD